MSTHPLFFKQPLRYLKWASINKPAYFYSCVVGLTGPVLVVVVPPIREYMGDEKRSKIPQTYPSMFQTTTLAELWSNNGGLTIVQYRRDQDRDRAGLRMSRRG